MDSRENQDSKKYGMGTILLSFILGGLVACLGLFVSSSFLKDQMKMEHDQQVEVSRGVYDWSNMKDELKQNIENMKSSQGGDSALNNQIIIDGLKKLELNLDEMVESEVTIETYPSIVFYTIVINDLLSEEGLNQDYIDAAGVLLELLNQKLIK